MKSNHTTDLPYRYGLAGHLALLVTQDPTAIRNLTARCSAKLHETLACVVLLSSLSIGLGGAFNLNAFSYLTITCIILLASLIKLMMISHERWLLTPALRLDASSSILASCHASSAALAWLQDIQSVGREIYGFDVEIMSLIEEAELLSAGTR